jgi:hypothetical protein
MPPRWSSADAVWAARPGAGKTDPAKPPPPTSHDVLRRGPRDRRIAPGQPPPQRRVTAAPTARGGQLRPGRRAAPHPWCVRRERARPESTRPTAPPPFGGPAFQTSSRCSGCPILSISANQLRDGISCCHAILARRSPGFIGHRGNELPKLPEGAVLEDGSPHRGGSARGDGQVFQRTFRRAAVGEVTVTMIGLRGGGRAP